MRAQVISFNCILKNKAGKFISSSFNREVLTALNHQPSGFLTGLTKGLQDIKKGEKRNISIFAEEAYGLYDPKKVILFPRRKLPPTIRKDEVINIAGRSGELRAYRVVEIHDEFVSLDWNHPLAGQDLIFEIETLDARDATLEEVAEASNVVATQLLH